jgi:hypothetical protein
VLVVCLGIVVLIVALFALREPKGHVAAAESGRTSSSNVADRTSTRATKTPTKSHHSTRPAGNSHATVHDVPLVVLNNTSTPGLAATAAHRFEAGGWTVRSTGNLVNDILSTCAYYDPASKGAQAAAEALQAQFPAIKRVEPKFPELPSGPVVVVLTDDYAAG